MNRVSNNRLAVFAACCMAACLMVAPNSLADTKPTEEALTLKEYLHRVLERNESIQMRMLETEVARRKTQGEHGIFEPVLVSSATRENNRRDNTIEQALSLNLGTTSTTVFKERNNIYDSGIEALVPTGAKLHFGYTLQDLNNNLNRTFFPQGEYNTIFGFTVTQPLLKNFGLTATMINIRLAALASDIAFQEYRQSMMETVAKAEATYWEVYLTQGQLEIAKGSIKLAETLLADNKKRFEVGKSPELEVLQAQAGLATRQSLLNDALQKNNDAVNRAGVLASGSIKDISILIRAADKPTQLDTPTSLSDHWQVALEHNSDYLIRKKRLHVAEMQLGYAKNQHLPELNLKGGAGVNGIGIDPQSSWNRVDQGTFPSWSFGVELRIPMMGGLKDKAELESAKLRYKQADLGIREIEVAMANGLDVALKKARYNKENVVSYQQVVDYNQKLLETQLVRLEGGKSDSRTVLQTEEDLFKARVSYLDAEVEYQRALLELELIQGSILRSRNMEMTQKQLADKTAMVFVNGKYSEEQYRYFMRSVVTDYELKSSFPTPATIPDLPARQPGPGADKKRTDGSQAQPQ